MDIVTYRYLMSALIQVFGALIAVDAIFLLLSYENSKNKLKVVRQQLLLHYIMARDYKKIFRPGNTFEYINCKKHIENFELSENKEIVQMIQNYGKNLKKEIKDKKRKLKEGPSQSGRDPDIETFQHILDVLESDKTHFENLNSKVKSFKKIVAKSMIIPASIALILAIELLLADIPPLPNSLLYYGVLSVLLSGAGFFSIIYYAITAIKE